jgi:hypothetical protein
VSSGRDDHGDPSTNQVSREHRQSIHLIVSPAVFDRHILMLDVACLFEALTRGAIALQKSVTRSRVKDPDNRHGRLLRARRERPCERRATEERDELAPSHSMTSSAATWRRLEEFCKEICD